LEAALITQRALYEQLSISKVASFFVVVPCSSPDLMFSVNAFPNIKSLKNYIASCSASSPLWQVAEIHSSKSPLGEKSLYFPTSVKKRRSGVVFKTLKEANLVNSIHLSLAQEVQGIELIDSKLIVWDNGIFWVEVEMVARFNGMQQLNSIAKIIDDRILDNVANWLSDEAGSIKAGFQELSNGQAAEFNSKPHFWSVLGQKRENAARLDGYGFNILLSSAGEPGVCIVNQNEFIATCKQLTGSNEIDLKRLESLGFVHAVGYEGQLCLSTNAANNLRIHSLWRLAAVKWATLELARSTMSEFAHLSESGSSSSGLGRSSLVALYNARTQVQLVNEEADPVVVCDDELDNYVYGSIWNAWQGKSLSERTRSLLGIVEGVL
jgi:hypothetical protein